MEKIIIDLEAKTGKATEDVKKFAKSIQDANKETTKLSETNKENAKSTGILQEKWNGVKDSFKGLTNSFKGAYQGLLGVAKGFGLSAKASKGLAIGLSALGLPLILAAVSALVEYFKNFEAGVKLLDKAMAGLGAIVGQLAAGFKALLSGDFSGAADSFKNIGSAAAEAAGQIDKLYEANKRLNDLQVKFATVNAELVANIERNRKIIEDETQTYEDRAAALKQVNADTLKLAENEKKVSEERLKSLKAQLAVENNFEKKRELELQIAEEQAALIAKNSAIETIVFDGNKKLRELDKRRSDEEKAQSDKRIEQTKKEIEERNNKIEQEKQERIKKANEEAKTEKERLESIAAIQDEFKKRREDEAAVTNLQKLELEKERKLLELEQLGADEQAKADIILFYNQKIAQENIAIKKKAGEEEVANAKAVANAEAAIRQGNLNNISSGFSLLGKLAGKNKALQATALIGESAVGIAKTIINTQAANSAAVLKYALLPGGIALAAAEKTINNVGAGISIAANLTATAKGLSALKAGGSPPSGAVPSNRGGGSAPSIPSAPPSFNVVGQSDTNQLADAIGSQSKQPTKAYVVSSDVTNAQEMDRNIISGASI